MGSPFNFELINFDGSHAQFSAVAGLTDEIKIGTVRSGNEAGFAMGDRFVGNGVDGQISRRTRRDTTGADQDAVVIADSASFGEPRRLPEQGAGKAFSRLIVELRLRQRRGLLTQHDGIAEGMLQRVNNVRAQVVPPQVEGFEVPQWFLLLEQEFPSLVIKAASGHIKVRERRQNR